MTKIHLTTLSEEKYHKYYITLLGPFRMSYPLLAVVVELNVLTKAF